MRLAAYLDEKEISDSDFADLLGVSRQAVYRYRTGERFPEPLVLSKISKVTAGKVTANDFVAEAANSRTL